MLSDVDLELELASGWLQISPLAPGAIQPASIDLRLGDEFRVWPSRDPIDPREPQAMALLRAEPGEHFLLRAGGFALAHTMETVALPANISGRYEGKSSTARLGLASHVTGAFIDPGFSGQITLELANLSGRDIMLWPGMPIGQLACTYLSTPARSPYGPARGSHYHGQQGATESRVHEQLTELAQR